MPYVARWYQYEAEQALHRYFAHNPPVLAEDGFPKSRNPLVCMPTGTGKSYSIGSYITSLCGAYPWVRVLMLTHVKELIQQNAEALLDIWPYAPLGIYSAGLKKREINNQIIYGGIGSLKNSVPALGHIDVIIIDECHLLSPTDTTMYQKFIAALKLVNPWLVVIGFTATPYRLGIGSLTNNGIFTDTAIDLTTLECFNRLVHEGYIAPLTHIRSTVELDVADVGLNNGDYKQKELQNAVDTDRLNDAIVRDILSNAYGRRSLLCFASGVEHAEHISETFARYGVTVPAVHSNMDGTRRDQIIAAFKAGHIWGVVNNNVLTTGFNHPPVDLIAMLRPTTSSGLWVQMLGRGTRPCFESGKTDCLVLDYAGNTGKLGPINDPVIPRMKGAGGGGKAPVWECPSCHKWNHAKAPACIYCGCHHDMTGNMQEQPAALEVMRGELPIVEMFKVTRALYYRHEKEGRPTSLRVVYQCGLRSFSEWVCFEHPGPAGSLARQWWRSRFLGDQNIEPPATTAEALELVSWLKTPERVSVWTNTTYPKVQGVEF